MKKIERYPVIIKIPIIPKATVSYIETQEAESPYYCKVLKTDLDQLERHIEQLESEIRSAMGDYNIICKSRNCEHFIEWECEIDKDCQPYPCTSCRLVGQSYDISELAKDCPFGQDVVEQLKEMK